MKKDAEKQRELITIAQIKETLKKASPDKFDKMIISDSEIVKRGNYAFVKLNYQKVERSAREIKFPLYGAIKDNFAELEGGLAKFGEKSIINSDQIFEILKSKYDIGSQGASISNLVKAFEFPIEAIGNEVIHEQHKYFFPDHTYQETCNECNEKKYIKCQDGECNGRHEWKCTSCHGEGKLICNECAGRKKVDCPECNGSNRVKCRNCGGDGKVNDGLIAKAANSKYAQEKRCGKCAGKGYVQCTNCTNGQITCRNCSGNGKVNCEACDGKGTIVCSECYGDKERYGQIDCPQCKTIGTMARIVYVESNVTENEKEKIFIQGEKLIVDDNNIKKHIKTNAKTELVYKKINNDLAENYDENSIIYAKEIEKELNLNKESFPLLTKEEIYYQVVPCVQLSYKHMLTNTLHEFTIVDFWDNPEIIFHSEPEQLKQDLGNATKAVGGFFGKLFKTKGFKTKEDKKNEIVLLIHLAKIDGKIEDQEKAYLSEMIGHLDDFTNSEKQKLFDIMNAKTLPELTKMDVTFSSKERGEEVIKKLTELASADGVIEELEEALINKIKGMM